MRATRCRVARFRAGVARLSEPDRIALVSGRPSPLVDTMQELDLQVIEDATYRDLVYDGAPQMPLLALDDDVIHIGTFSKVMMPALRIGYIVARGALREQPITLRNIACGSAYGPCSAGGHRDARDGSV
ncbi:MAG: aminotransferase class I/II-fold pyridoxal phosphate-dependent enzyme [Chloroflexi bacterium]|nr:aminotransferase class I/II-fold pyridoxal phosphate-dependent enzyme [Chloroflexota bacterium]